MLEKPHFLFQSPKVIIDPLSEVLKLAKVTTAIAGGWTARAAWGLRFPARGRIKFYGIVRGSCWLKVEGMRTPLRLSEGDVFLLSGAKRYELTSAPGVPVRDATSLFGNTTFVALERAHSSDFEIFGGHVLLRETSGSFFRNALPALIHAPSSSAAGLMVLVRQLITEYRAQGPGASLICAYLSELIFLQLLRAGLMTSTSLGAGWARAIADKKIAPALRLVHEHPGKAWSLAALAKASGLSRSTFFDAFKAAAGVSPLRYVAAWRIELAKRALEDEDIAIAQLAFRLGYGSESAFTHAFQRLTGSSPRGFRNAARQVRAGA